MIQFKTDENVHPEIAELLRDKGHDAITIWDQNLRGRTDSEIAEVCRNEKRAIITFDLGFTDTRVYPPEKYAGLIVLRLGSQARPHVLAVVKRLLPKFGHDPLSGTLWIVDEVGVRIREGSA